MIIFLIINLIEEFDEYQYTTETNDCYTNIIPQISNLFLFNQFINLKNENIYLMKNIS